MQAASTNVLFFLVDIVIWCLMLDALLSSLSLAYSINTKQSICHGVSGIGNTCDDNNLEQRVYIHGKTR